MSERNSTPLPISGSTSGDHGDVTADLLTDGLDLGFDGAEDMLRSWRRGMRPDPDLTVSEWADQHRKLSSRASAEPGQYRTARTPYLREIMDALSPRHPAQRISFMKAAQVGATEAGIDRHHNPRECHCDEHPAERVEIRHQRQRQMPSGTSRQWS